MALVEEQLEKNGILLKPKPTPEAADAEEEAKAEEVVELRAPKICPGAPPALLQKQQEKQLSKSALRRLKRKQSAAGGKEDDDEDDAKTPTTAPNTASSASSVSAATKAPVAAPIAAPTPAPAPAVMKPVETLSMADLMDDFSGSPAFKLSSLASLSLGASAPTAAAIPAPAKPTPSFNATAAVPPPPGLWTEPDNGAQPPLSTSSAPAAPNDKYFKSRSGFSVRL